MAMRQDEIFPRRLSKWMPDLTLYLRNMTSCFQLFSVSFSVLLLGGELKRLPTWEEFFGQVPVPIRLMCVWGGRLYKMGLGPIFPLIHIWLTMKKLIVVLKMFLNVTVYDSDMY